MGALTLSDGITAIVEGCLFLSTTKEGVVSPLETMTQFSTELAPLLKSLQSQSMADLANAVGKQEQRAGKRRQALGTCSSSLIQISGQ